MRTVVFLLSVLAGNWLSFALVTRPAVDERKGLETRQRELDDAIASRRGEVAQWRKLARVVELAQPVLGPFPSWDGGSLPSLRAALIDAEKGLPLQRLSLEFRPDDQSSAGVHASRILVSERGDFASLRTYLERVSRLRAPIAPITMSLVEDGKGEDSLRLNVTWYYLWPEESG